MLSKSVLVWKHISYKGALGTFGGVEIFWVLTVMELYQCIYLSKVIGALTMTVF
jgi:hypothetical protein